MAVPVTPDFAAGLAAAVGQLSSALKLPREWVASPSLRWTPSGATLLVRWGPAPGRAPGGGEKTKRKRSKRDREKLDKKLKKWQLNATDRKTAKGSLNSTTSIFQQHRCKLCFGPLWPKIALPRNAEKQKKSSSLAWPRFEL